MTTDPEDDAAGQDRRSGGSPSWLWLVLGAAILAGGLGIFFMSSSSGLASTPAKAAAGEETPLVETVTAEIREPVYTVEAPGRLKPRQTLRVVGEVAGKVTGMHPQLIRGGRIAAGETLLRIDPGDYLADVAHAEARLETAQANLERARAEHARQARLAEIGATPQAALESAVAALADARAAVSQAEAQLDVARRNLEKTSITAPFPALVIYEDVSEGTYVAPGAELARVIDTRAGEITAGLSPEDVDAVRRARARQEGAQLDVRAVPNEGSLSSRTLTGYLDTLSPAIDPASRTVTAIAVFPEAFAPGNDGEVFAEDFMTLQIEGRGEGPLYEMPAGVLRRDSYVWRLDEENRLVRTPVEPVQRGDGRVILRAGTRLEGARVMVTPLAEETEGMKVRLASDAPAGGAP